MPSLGAVPVPPLFKKLVAAFPLITYPERPPLSEPPKRPTLWIYGPGLSGSPASFDVECLKHQAWLRFHDVDFGTRDREDAYGAPGERLPVLHLPDGSLLEPSAIPAWVARRPQVREEDVETRDEAKAWTAGLETKLHAALLLTLYHTPLYHAYTVPLYHPKLSSPTPILTSLVEKIVAFDAHRTATAHLRSLLPDRPSGSWWSASPPLDSTEILRESRRLLSALADRISPETAERGGWILGDGPTSLDAALFAYLRVILTLPGLGKDRKEKCVLRRDVEASTKLVQWERAVLARHFPSA